MPIALKPLAEPTSTPFSRTCIVLLLPFQTVRRWTQSMARHVYDAEGTETVYDVPVPRIVHRALFAPFTMLKTSEPPVCSKVKQLFPGPQEFDHRTCVPAAVLLS